MKIYAYFTLMGQSLRWTLKLEDMNAGARKEHHVDLVVHHER